MNRVALLVIATAVAGLASGRQVKSPDPDPPPPVMTLERILKTYPKDEEAVEKLFKVTLDRKPTADESRTLMAAVAARGAKGRMDVYRDIQWAITNSAEFVAKQKAKDKAKDKTPKPK